MLSWLNLNRHRKVLSVSILASLCPVAIYIGTSILGRIGCVFGYLLELILFLSWPVLGIYLLTALMLGRMSTRLAVAHVSLLILCVFGMFWSVYSHPFLTEFELKLKRVYNNVPELQTWAIGLLDSHKNQDFTLDRDHYPDWIKSKDFPEPFIRVYNEDGTKYEYVELSWNFGNQFGQFGLVAGRPGLPKQGIKWTDGVYFYVEPQPLGWRE